MKLNDIKGIRRNKIFLATIILCSEKNRGFFKFSIVTLLNLLPLSLIVDKKVR